MTNAKAIIGGITSAILAGLSALAVVVVGDATLSQVTTGQWIAVAIAVITAGSSAYGLVYVTSNKPASAPADV